MIIPGFKLEKALTLRGHKTIAGVDEAGRGSLAGPVVAAAVIFPNHIRKKHPLIRDSKTLSHKQRIEAFKIINKAALAIGIGKASNKYIDKYGITRAVTESFVKAVNRLVTRPDYILIDGNLSPEFNQPSQTVVRGEGISASIAAASIVAKVTRDLIMIKLSKKYSPFLFYKHKGYGTSAHFEQIFHYGPSEVHRYSYLSKFFTV